MSSCCSTLRLCSALFCCSVLLFSAVVGLLFCYLLCCLAALFCHDQLHSSSSFDQPHFLLTFSHNSALTTTLTWIIQQSCNQEVSLIYRNIQDENSLTRCSTPPPLLYHEPTRTATTTWKETPIYRAYNHSFLFCSSPGPEHHFLLVHGTAPWTFISNEFPRLIYHCSSTLRSWNWVRNHLSSLRFNVRVVIVINMELIPHFGAIIGCYFSLV